MSARVAHQRFAEQSGIDRGHRSIDQTTRNFFGRSYKHRRLFRYNEGERVRGRETSERDRYFNARLWYDNAPVHGIMYIGSCMIIWRDKAALSRHKLNRFFSLSLSLLPSSLSSYIVLHPPSPTQIIGRNAHRGEGHTCCTLWYHTVRKRDFPLRTSLFLRTRTQVATWMATSFIASW